MWRCGMVSSSFKTRLNVQILSHKIQQPLQRDPWWCTLLFWEVNIGYVESHWHVRGVTFTSAERVTRAPAARQLEISAGMQNLITTLIFTLSLPLSFALPSFWVSPSLQSLWFSSFLRGAAHLHIWQNLIIFLPPTHRFSSFLFSFFFSLCIFSLYFSKIFSLFFFFFCERPPWVKLHCFTNSIKRLINNLRAGQFSEQSFFLCPNGNPAKASKCCSNRPWITINPAWLDLPIVIPVLQEQDQVRARLETAGVEKRDNWSEREGERMI